MLKNIDFILPSLTIHERFKRLNRILITLLMKQLKTIKNVVKNWVDITDYCHTSRDRHLNENVKQTTSHKAKIFNNNLLADLYFSLSVNVTCFRYLMVLCAVSLMDLVFNVMTLVNLLIEKEMLLTPHLHFSGYLSAKVKIQGFAYTVDILGKIRSKVQYAIFLFLPILFFLLTGGHEMETTNDP